ncbi:3-deoxy-D-manno-octulosonate 8-phosphate phosphatase [Bacteroidia bacterium]|nr:3-deoxy-D-manno-octulosonate 8-phosphate phosphatase [Bacteroidia bacterium]
MTTYKTRLKDITTFIFDYDGVMSDGMVYTVGDYDQIRNSNVKDGYALHQAVKKGYHIAVISGGRGDSMRSRLATLGITDVFQGVGNKKQVFEDYCKEHHLQHEEILYMGDDIPDYEVIQIAGIGTCPANSVPEIKAVAHYISPFEGGHCCVRDVIEQVMKVRGDWMQHDAVIW